MLQAVMIMGGLGLVIGIALAAASKIFYVFVDPKILAVDDILPGANCGGCGFPGCNANAEAVVAGTSPPNSCVAAGPEVAEAIAQVLGVTVEAIEPDIALPGCTYGVADADLKYLYDGLNDCRAAALLGGGMKICTIGCLGLGTCAKACPFDAIIMGPEGLPEVDEALCTGCGTCERVCPKHIITLSSVTRRILREYTTDDCTTPCQRACPAGIDICEYIRQIALGDYAKAVQVIKERNPFPTVIGRICPRPCELDCRRNLTDESVAINFLKRFAADYEMKSGQRIQPYRAPDTQRKIAVVGGGVEGLSVAFFAARLGHAITVFEATDKLGGLLRSAIATERLPMKILDWDIEGILEMGVTAQTGMVLGIDFSVASLLQDGYEAVFLAAGGWDSRLARGGVRTVESPIPGTYLLLDLLKSGDNGSTIACGEHAVILGGHQLALKAAERCKALGARRVTLMLRETQQDTGLDKSDLEALIEADIQIIWNAGITRFIGEGNRLTALEYADLATSETQQIAADTLVLASGRFPELVFTVPKSDDEPDTQTDTQPDAGETAETAESATDASIATDTATPPAVLHWEAIAPYKQPDTGQEQGVFSQGDVLSDYSAAIKAIGAGRRGAASIHKLVYGIALDLPANVVTHKTRIQNVDKVEQVETAARQIMPMCTPAERGVCEELEKGFSLEAAQKEAARCLRCGLICYERPEMNLELAEMTQ